WGEGEPIAERAVRDLLGMRGREGAAVAAELGGRLGALETGARTIEQRAPERLTAELARLKTAVAELAAGVPVDEQRLAVEVALMADRSEEHTSELQSRFDLVCRLLLEKKKNNYREFIHRLYIPFSTSSEPTLCSTPPDSTTHTFSIHTSLALSSAPFHLSPHCVSATRL